jgi:hypothetical protein
VTADFREVNLLARRFIDRIQSEDPMHVLHELAQYPPYVSQAIAMRMGRLARGIEATLMIDVLIRMAAVIERRGHDDPVAPR